MPIREAGKLNDILSVDFYFNRNLSEEDAKYDNV